MIAAQRGHLLPITRAKDCSAVSDVRCVADLTHDQDDDGAGARSLNHRQLAGCLILSLTHLEETRLCLGKSLVNGLFWLPREAFLFDDVVVQVISQVLGACATSMSIVDTEEGASRPRLVLSMLWLDYVENDGHSILVIVSD